MIVDITGDTICVIACRYSGGFGPGDYQNLWCNAQDAFEDVRTLLIERDLRIKAKDAGRQLHPRPSIAVEFGSVASLREPLIEMGFVVNETFTEARDTAGGGESRQPALEVSGGGTERAYVFLHPRGFWRVRSFLSEPDRWFGDFEHSWANPNEVIADLDDFLRCNPLRRKAFAEGREHATSHR